MCKASFHHHRPHESEFASWPQPPVQEPPNAPNRPPVEEPGKTPPEPPPPPHPPMEEPPDKPKKPPLKEPPPDPNRRPPHLPPDKHAGLLARTAQGVEIKDPMSRFAAA